MSNKRRHGDGDDNVALEPTDFTDTTPIVGPEIGGDDMRDVDSVGVQLVVDFLEEGFSLTGSDSVDDSSKTWTLSGFDFTGLANATIVVSGTSTSDGTFVIASVSSAHVIVTTTSPGADETFTAAGRVVVQHTEDPPAGDWKIEVSNDFVPNCNGSVYGQSPNDGTWTDITSEFSPSISSVTTANTQYIQADLTARTIRYTFTPSGGSGSAKVLRFAKSWS